MTFEQYMIQIPAQTALAPANSVLKPVGLSGQLSKSTITTLTVWKRLCWSQWLWIVLYYERVKTSFCSCSQKHLFASAGVSFLGRLGNIIMFSYNPRQGIISLRRKWILHILSWECQRNTNHQQKYHWYTNGIPLVYQPNLLESMFSTTVYGGPIYFFNVRDPLIQISLLFLTKQIDLHDSSHVSFF